MQIRKQNFNICLYSDIYRISFKLGLMIETTKFYILILVWMTLVFIQGHSYMRTQKPSVHFLANIYINLDEIL